MSASPSPGWIRARESNQHTYERAAAAYRRRVPTQIKEDYPLRVAKKVVYTSYAPRGPYHPESKVPKIPDLKKNPESILRKTQCRKHHLRSVA